MIHLKSGKMSVACEMRTDSEGDICFYLDNILFAWLDVEYGRFVFVPINPKHHDTLRMAGIELDEIDCEHGRGGVYLKHFVISHNFRCSMSCMSNNSKSSGGKPAKVTEESVEDFFNEEEGQNKPLLSTDLPKAALTPESLSVIRRKTVQSKK